LIDSLNSNTRCYIFSPILASTDMSIFREAAPELTACLTRHLQADLWGNLSRARNRGKLK